MKATTSILARAVRNADRAFLEGRKAFAYTHCARRLFEADATARSIAEMEFARAAALAGARALRAVARALHQAKESAR
jgi:hypothetical protein